MVFVYILRLENEKFYIGKTTKPEFRIEQHFDLCGLKNINRLVY